VISLPVVIADYDDERYLVSMLGEKANCATRERRAATPCLAMAAAKPYASRRSPQKLGRRSCVDTWNGRRGARPHIPIDRRAAPEEFERIAPGIPVFRIRTEASGRA
jgi:hypothetical protein